MNRYINLKQFIFHVAKPYKWYFYGMLLIGIYSAIHSAMQPYVLKMLLDSANNGLQNNSLIKSSIVPASILIFISLVIALVWRGYNFLVLKSLPKMKADIIKITTTYLRAHSFEYFQNNLSGSLSAKVSDLTNNLQNLINTVFNISRQALTIIISVLIAYTVDPIFSFIFLLCAMAFFFMSYYCSNSIKPYAKKYAQSKNKSLGTIVDCFANATNMKLFAREQHEADYLNSSVDESVKKDERMQWKNMTNALILSSIAWLLQASSILALLFLANKGKITIGDFALVFVLSITVIDQIWFLTESLLGIGETVGICDQALKTIFAKQEYVEPPNIPKLKITQGNITIKQVNFNYQRSINLFNDLNLTIKGGDKIALVGFSGGGKSSLINLITRLFETNHGEILIDDQNIKNISTQSLRENISFIPQDPSLFHRSILENIQYGKLNASLEEVIDASKKAYAHEFITGLQDGYNTIVGERGIKLSGGQRQRIAIARAILKNAPILILDEATSSLDSLTESRIQKSLTYAMNNKTVIVIAHRLSTVLAMDIIYVLDKGKIIESGHHKELVKKGGLYKELWDLQKGHSYI